MRLQLGGSDDLLPFDVLGLHLLDERRRIARQFGVSQSDVRKALTTGASKGGSIG